MHFSFKWLNRQERFCGPFVPPPPLALIKKKIRFSSYIGKFRVDQLQSHIWLTASSYMGNNFRISSYIRKSFLIYDFASAPLWFPYIWGKFYFIFYQWEQLKLYIWRPEVGFTGNKFSFSPKIACEINVFPRFSIFAKFRFLSKYSTFCGCNFDKSVKCHKFSQKNSGRKEITEFRIKENVIFQMKKLLMTTAFSAKMKKKNHFRLNSSQKLSRLKQW